MTQKDFIAGEKARAAVFNIFTALLCQPDQAVIDSPKVFDVLGEGLKAVCPAGEGDALLLKKEIRKHTRTELLVEYTRLFIGPSKMVAPPYSSIYFGTEYVLMSDVTIWVMNFYERNGLRYNEKIKDVPDHIAIETEFLYHLIFLELKALQRKDVKQAKKIWRSQSEFFNKHFIKWVPAFCDKIVEGNRNEYYRLLAGCLKRFVLDTPVTDFPEKIKKR